MSTVGLCFCPDSIVNANLDYFYSVIIISMRLIKDIIKE